MSSQEYPAWIDDYARMMHAAFTHMVPADWGPLDFMACWEHMNGTSIEHLHGAVSALKKNGASVENLANRFLSPSSLRACTCFLFYEWKKSDHTRKEQTREILDFFVSMLGMMFKRDVWCERENVIHAPEEVRKLIDNLPLNPAAAGEARIIARLGNSASAVSYALYRDFYMMESFDVLGPYDVSDKFGEGSIFVQRTYPKMRPIELWPETASSEYSSVNLYLIYQDVSMHCEFIGAHTVYEGDTIAGLRQWAVEVDGKFITDLAEVKRISGYLAEGATKYWSFYDDMRREDLQLKFLEWTSYAFKPIFDAAGIDWRPTDAMKAALVGKPVDSRIKIDSFPSFEEYVSSPEWEVYWLKQLYS